MAFSKRTCNHNNFCKQFLFGPSITETDDKYRNTENKTETVNCTDDLSFNS